MTRMMLQTGGIQLHWDEHGDSEPLLWLHGFMGHGPDWRFVFPEAPDGFRLIAPDLRGQGRSTGEDAARYSFKQSALDVLALLDELEIAKIRIIGLSGGGITALHLATLSPSRVDAMIVVSAPAVFPESARALQRTYSEAMLGEDERARMRVRHQRPGQADKLFAQVRAFADGDDPSFSATTLATITASTLIVFGDRDPLYPVSSAVELREAIPRSFLWGVPKGGHGPIFGPHAARFRETAMEFLSRAAPWIN